MKKRTYILLTLLCILQAACSKSPDIPKDKKLIVCTTGYVADLVRQIAGNEAHVVSLMGSGVDPHLFKPGLRDVDLLDQADLIVSNGLHLEGKMSGILSRMGDTRQVIVLSDTLLPDELLELPDGVTHDPHFWFDAVLWKKAGQYFARRYSALAWADTGKISAKAHAFGHRMDTLHAFARHAINTIPASARILVTAHDAFGYFSRAYGIRVKALQGISTVAEYGLRDMADLQNFLIQHRIPAIFVESSVPRRSVNAIVEGCRQKGFSLQVGGELFSDALGEENTSLGTYEGVFRYNVSLIVSNLTKNTAL